MTRYKIDPDLKYKEPREVLSVKEAAVFLGLSINCIYTYMSMGKLPAFKKGNRCYFKKEELEIYLKLKNGKSLGEIAIERDRILYNKKGPNNGR